MMIEKQIPLVCIVGPTASGKTALSIGLAQKLNGEIVSADSMQIYRYMDIGTAKPSLEEQEGIPHHLLDFLEPGEAFSAAQFVQLAHGAIADIHARGKLPILVGGTGLYVSSLIDNLQFAPMENDPALRAALEEEAATYGNEHMLSRLQAVDNELAQRLHPNNLGRIIRALEVTALTGIPMSTHQRLARQAPSPYRLCMLGLRYHDRSVLYERINRRVELMRQAGLVEETKALIARGFGKTARQAIGYKELFPYLEGEANLEDCLAEIAMQSRRYAKRQLTWFGRDERVHWLEPDSLPKDSTLLELALKQLEISSMM